MCVGKHASINESSLLGVRENLLYVPLAVRGFLLHAGTCRKDDVYHLEHVFLEALSQDVFNCLGCSSKVEVERIVLFNETVGGIDSLATGYWVSFITKVRDSYS